MKLYIKIIILVLVLIPGSQLQVLASDDNQLETNLNSARNAYYQGHLEKSLQKYEEILDSIPGHRETILNLIQINRELGNISQLETYYKQLIEREPDNVDYRFQLGIIYYQQGEYDRSHRLLQEIKQKNERTELSSRETGLLFYYLGENYLYLHQIDRAIQNYSRGIEAYPDLTLNYLGIADIYRQQEKYKRATEYYKMALSKDFSLSEIYPLLASCYLHQGQLEPAYRYLKKSINSGTGGEEVQKTLKYLENNYSWLMEEEEEEKRQERVDIDWYRVKPLTDGDQLPIIRVGLVDKIDSMTFQTRDSFILRNTAGDIIFAPETKEGEWQIEYENNKFNFYHQGELQKTIYSAQPLRWDYNITAIYDITFGSGYFWSGTEDRQYRGEIELYPVTADSFNVINVLNIAEYLFSVVPAEMPAWWPTEALKTQAVAARSYVLKNRGRYSHQGYDLCSGVNCMVYKGIESENPRTNQAVLETEGEVATHNGNIIEAVFSSNSGGYTESSEDVWGFELPYLTGTSNMKDDKYSFPLQPFELYNWLLQDPSSYAEHPRYTGSNTYRWTREIPVSYLEQKFSLELQDVMIQGRGQGGSVEEILLVGKENKITISRDSIRSKLGGLRSNRFIIIKNYDSGGDLSSIHFYGAGWGHNVGLDQTASAGMAESGYKYQDIIKHFYPGTKIVRDY